MSSKALIFDMDGVLLDSEPYYYKYLMARFRELDLHVTDEQYATFVGLPSRQVWKRLEKMNGRSLDIEDLMKDEENLVNEIFSSSPITPTEGLGDLLNKIQDNKIPMNVASSSYRSTIEIIVKRLGISDYFNFLVSGTEVPNGKPHPDIFLKSAEIHNRAPEDCIVIEDSSNGIAGANSAGMTSVGFQNPGSGNQDLSQADIVIKDFGQESIDKILALL